MRQKTPSLHPLAIMDTAKQTIFEQKSLLLCIRRTAWYLFEIQLIRTDPATGKPYTPYKALDNTLKWMAEQSELLERVKREPTQMQKTLLQMLVDGKSQKEIAFHMSVNPRTLRRRFDQMRDRLSVDTLFEAVAISVKKGWIKVERPEHDPLRINRRQHG